ncbi:MAG: RdgB/HAM1 family non-canonical purine NTP pyrophosphatase [Fibrobacterota bacterium]|jgi:XTP/dITP diphosphohydrolase|nr:RdgB/HAM1 family non-canonical purine NTP pyrophosphatase [Chitinispirillaceae bacterium]
MRKIVVASGNKGKLAEIREILKDLPVELLPMSDLWNPVPDIDENGKSFFDNALIKAEYVFKRSGLWALADDSGLEVDSLSGEPGVYSARYAGKQGDNEANNALLLRKLNGVPPHLRTARFRCVMVLKTGISSTITSEGTCEGTIGFELKGKKGFGYDPLFVPTDETMTFAELSSEKKNQISHRGKALALLCRKLHELDI